MFTIDAHAHVFPAKIAHNAVKSISNFYQQPMCGDGTAEDLIRRGTAEGIDKFVIHSVATAPAQIKSINNFIMSIRDSVPDRVIPFATLHPDAQNVERIVDDIIAAGFAGIKLHPDMQKFQIDEERSLKMLAAFAGKLPVLIHTGDYRYDNSGPERILHVHEELPELTMICAHLGGWSEWDKAARLLPGHGLYVDTSSALFYLTPERATEIIRSFGADHVLFGTDFPMWTPDDELQRFNKLLLTDEERELILGLNAKRLLLDR